MVIAHSAPLQKVIEERILARTGRRVRNLEVQYSTEEIVLLGETATYHIKQLAQHEVLESWPTVRLQNRITVQ